MDGKKSIYNLIILDESGSMTSIKNATISGFNELIQSIQAEAEKDQELKQYIQFFSFNSDSIKEHVPLQLVSDIKPLNSDSYIPTSMTPLFDAVGHCTAKLRYALEAEKDYAVLVTILTDGAENASKEYTKQTISNIIKQLEEQDWVFTYMGTNHDVNKQAHMINIVNKTVFNYNDQGVKMAMDEEKKNRLRFYANAKSGDLKKE